LDVHPDSHCLQPDPAAQAGGGYGIATTAIRADSAETIKSMHAPARQSIYLLSGRVSMLTALLHPGKTPNTAKALPVQFFTAD
jgi:hypothetical protein